MQRSSQGFALPDILIISFIVLIVLSSLMSFTSLAFRGVHKDYYQTLAEEAAEAGTAYATSCLWRSGKSQTWGSNRSRPDLSPATDCTGTVRHPGNAYVYQAPGIRTRFTVPNLDFAADYAVQITAVGHTEVLRRDGSISATYTSVIKKTITWLADLNATQSASGSYRTCAILSGQVWCWGYGSYGQLGNGKYRGGPGGNDIQRPDPHYDSNVPVRVKREPGGLLDKRVVKIFTAQHHSCALTAEGEMYCWGRNEYGQLGTGNVADVADAATPQRVLGLLQHKRISDIGGTGDTSCAIAEGKIYCWGRNDRGTAGVGSNDPKITTPRKLTTTGTATKLATDGTRSLTMCAIISGKAWCWGHNRSGAVGDGTNKNRHSPTKVDDSGALRGKTVTDISQDGYSWGRPEQQGEHVCAVASGKVYCWGNNAQGQSGRNTTKANPSDNSTGKYLLRPQPIETGSELHGKTITEVHAGVFHTCALADGEVYCWGSRLHGRLGDGNIKNDHKHTPLRVAGELKHKTVRRISAGANRGCALISDGRTFCWGRNSEGQIGDGTLIDRALPTEALFLRPVANQYIY
ncbi:MAG: hypothetical protein Q4A37_01285 [Candidatus Saccharibacteria bacterium]|nr:hypothetical protein [Candidatus Saccharibacteria bacterium]